MTAQVMTRAWEIARAAATIFGGNAIEYIRGGAVKMAWAEAEHKPATKEDKIKALEDMGFKRWQKGNFDRLYVNAGVLGLVCEYRRTGSISDAYFNGSEISNGEARRMAQQGGLSVNGAKAGPDRVFTAADLVDDRVAVLRSGKKNYFLLRVR